MCEHLQILHVIVDIIAHTIIFQNIIPWTLTLNGNPAEMVYLIAKSLLKGTSYSLHTDPQTSELENLHKPHRLRNFHKPLVFGNFGKITHQ